MQTFLPYANFRKSARCLDRVRCFKQVVECRQILATAGVRLKKKDGTWTKSTHPHHPIHKIWQGYIEALKFYHNCFLDQSLKNGYNTKIRHLRVGPVSEIEFPPFIGNEIFHASHRSNLLRKDADYYGQFGWGEPDNLPYVWGV